MKLFHGTDSWTEIQKTSSIQPQEGWYSATGIIQPHTFLADDADRAKEYGKVVLEIAGDLSDFQPTRYGAGAVKCSQGDYYTLSVIPLDRSTRSICWSSNNSSH
jgi:hypothetical protein